MQPPRYPAPLIRAHILNVLCPQRFTALFRQSVEPAIHVVAAAGQPCGIGEQIGGAPAPIRGVALPQVFNAVRA